MAVTKIKQLYSTVHKGIEYIINPDKTEIRVDDYFREKGKVAMTVLTEYFGCGGTAAQVAEDFNLVRKGGTGRGNILAQHIMQSFKPGEVTPEEAHKIGSELAEKFLGDNYQYVLSTHVDKGHIHNHIIFNNIGMTDYRSFEYTRNRGKTSWKDLRKASDELCAEHGLSVIKEPGKRRENECQKLGQDTNRSYRKQLRKIIRDTLKQSASFEDLLDKLSAAGVTSVYEPNKKISLKFKVSGQERFTRARTLGEYYEPENLKNVIEDMWAHRLDRSAIIDVTAEKYAEAPGLRKWAEIHNIKELAEAVNRRTELIQSATKRGGATGGENRELDRLDKVISDYSELQRKER